MPSFQYEAMNAQGGVVSGTIVAAQEDQAVERLGENNLVVLSLTEKKERQHKTAGGSKKVKPADLTFFSRQLSAMLSAGIPVTQSIATLARQTENPTLREVLSDIAASVDGGLGLSQSFARHPKVFNKLYVSMISAGEMGGMLEAVLDRLAVMLQKEKQLNDNIKAATPIPRWWAALRCSCSLVCSSLWCRFLKASSTPAATSPPLPPLPLPFPATSAPTGCCGFWARLRWWAA